MNNKKATLIIVGMAFLLMLGYWIKGTLDFADANSALTVDEIINKRFEPITGFLASIIFVSFNFFDEYSIPFIILWLLGGAIFFTLYFRFINIRKFKLAIDIVRGKYTTKGEEGEVSHFQALTAALSGTVGLGNIAGVAIAIAVGGPGATFWMILVGLLGMSTKFVECTLGVRYRQIDSDGTVLGGPMYYLKHGFEEIKIKVAGGEKNYKKIGTVLATVFAIFCVGGSFGGGNMFQVNQAFKQFSSMSFVQGTQVAEQGWIFGLITAGMVAIVIVGGIKSIAKVTDKIVPAMCGIYVIAALVVIFGNITHLPEAVGLIFKGAFTGTAAFGGFIGVMIQGIKRAVFSNEAGVGSASIAHSAVKTKYPASEGIVALLEPFIDTVVVCTMTALVIIITGEYLHFEGGGTEAGVALTSSAFESVISWFPYVLTVAVILFAFSTMISWSYYGLQAWKFLFGKSKAADLSYKILFCTFVVIGASMSLGSVTDFSDTMILAMCFPNIIGLIFLLPVVKEELNRYMDKIKNFRKEEA